MQIYGFGKASKITISKSWRKYKFYARFDGFKLSAVSYGRRTAIWTLIYLIDTIVLECETASRE